MHLHKPRVTIGIVVAAVALLAVYAGTSAAKSRDTITITFMEAMASGTQKPALDTLTRQFEHANPNINVVLIAEPNYGILQQKEQAAIAAGTPPNMGQAYENWAAGYADAKAIVPLDSYVNDKKAGVAPAAQKQFWRGVWKDLYLPDGKIWMWPFNKSDYVMYYNASKLAAAGLTVPSTWVQYAAVAKRLTVNGDWAQSMDTGTLSSPANGTYVYLSIVRAFGGQWVKDGKPTLDTPAAVKALSFLKNLKNIGALQIGTNYPGQTALGAGRSAFDLSTVAGYPYVVKSVGGKFTLKVAPMPSGRNGQGNSMQGTNIVMFAKSSRAQRAAAWEYMKFLSQPRQTAYWASQTGYLPVTRAALPFMRGYIATHPYQTIAAQALDFAGGSPPYAWWTTAVGQVAQALQAVLDNGAQPSAALANAQQAAMAAAAAGS